MRLHEQLREQAIPTLTGLFNHRHLHERLEEISPRFPFQPAFAR
jgi:PleD family two-component response regulator